MNSEQKKMIYQLIEKEIIKIIDKVKKLKIDAQPISPENAIGRVSRMDAINNKSITEVALKAAEIKLKNLQNTKEKVEMENFGKCIKCLRIIPIQRILIIPESKKCVNCAN